MNLFALSDLLVFDEIEPTGRTRHARRREVVVNGCSLGWACVIACEKRPVKKLPMDTWKNPQDNGQAFALMQSALGMQPESKFEAM